jgi:hypothetical protein
MVYTGNLDDKVSGEEWDVKDEDILRIDILEGHPVWYKRESVHFDLQGYVYQSREGKMPDCELNQKLEYEWEGDW